MAQFIEKQWMHTVTCGTCGVMWAMPATFMDARQSDGKAFFCPNGDARVYRETTEDRLKRDLERTNQMLEAAQAKAETAEKSLGQVARAHRKMRERVMNGVCPCCNRTFQNLRQHMQTEHADFGAVRTLFALRQAFGMTQADVAREAGVDTSYVSLFERDKRTPRAAERRLKQWLEEHGADSKVRNPDSKVSERYSESQEEMAEWTGLEPATPGVTGRSVK